MALRVRYPRSVSLNDTVTIEASVTQDGASVDPGGLTFSYQYDMAGITTTLKYGTDPGLVRDSTGHYHVGLNVLTTGLLNLSYVATGTAADAYYGYLYIEPNPFAQSIPGEADDVSVLHVDNEVLTGTVNGTNTSFSTTYTPIANSLMLLYKSASTGVRTILVEGDEFTRSGSVISTTFAPLTGDELRGFYRVSV